MFVFLEVEKIMEAERLLSFSFMQSILPSLAGVSIFRFHIRNQLIGLTIPDSKLFSASCCARVDQVSY